jgi:hypothetical protein
MTLYTAQQALKVMEEVVNEFGDDYVYGDEQKNEYGDCVYANEDGTPSCLVGHVIARLDPDAFDNVVYKEQELGSTPAHNLTNEGYVQLGFWDENTAYIMMEAQGAQDTGSTWGEAYQRALLDAKRRGVEVDHD